MAMGDIVTLAIDTIEGDHYELPSVEYQKLLDCVIHAKGDASTFSVVNVSSAALVIPRRIVNAVSVGRENENSFDWVLLWTKKGGFVAA